MFAKQLVFIIIFTLLMSCPAFAQGEFLKSGENGFGVSGLKSFGGDTEGFGAGFGFCFAGVYEISFSYVSNDEGTADSYSPSFTYYFKDDQPNKTVGVGVTAGFSHTGAGGQGTNWALFGLTAFSSYFANDDIALQVSISGAALVALEDRSDNMNIGITPALALLLARNSPFRVFAGVAYTITDDDIADKYFSVATGFVIAWQ